MFDISTKYRGWPLIRSKALTKVGCDLLLVETRFLHSNPTDRGVTSFSALFTKEMRPDKIDGGEPVILGT